VDGWQIDAHSTDNLKSTTDKKIEM
jgi:hypothetical protein